jgi:hypothetical protein
VTRTGAEILCDALALSLALCEARAAAGESVGVAAESGERKFDELSKIKDCRFPAKLRFVGDTGSPDFRPGDFNVARVDSIWLCMEPANYVSRVKGTPILNSYPWLDSKELSSDQI